MKGFLLQDETTLLNKKRKLVCEGWTAEEEAVLPFFIRQAN